MNCKNVLKSGRVRNFSGADSSFRTLCIIKGLDKTQQNAARGINPSITETVASTNTMIWELVAVGNNNVREKLLIENSKILHESYEKKLKSSVLCAEFAVTWLLLILSFFLNEYFNTPGFGAEPRLETWG